MIGHDAPLEPPRAHQRRVDTLFARESGFWQKIYESSDVFGVIYRERRARALAWAETLQLPPQARVLEVGCGAGLTALTLAEQGYDVDATDAVAEMLELAKRNAAERGVDLRVGLADAHALSFEGGTFDLVLALGVVPWLHAPAHALSELARVSKIGGFVIVSADNRRRLTTLLDPAITPALAPMRAVVKRLFRLRPREAPIVNMHTRHEFDRLLADAGLEKLTSVTLGFGPLTFLWRLLPDRLGLPLNHRLQALADRGVPLLRSGGAQYVVLARHHTQGPSRPLRCEGASGQGDPACPR